MLTSVVLGVGDRVGSQTQPLPHGVYDLRSREDKLENCKHAECEARGGKEVQSTEAFIQIKGFGKKPARIWIFLLFSHFECEC